MCIYIYRSSGLIWLLSPIYLSVSVNLVYIYIYSGRNQAAHKLRTTIIGSSFLTMVKLSAFCGLKAQSLALTMVTLYHISPFFGYSRVLPFFPFIFGPSLKF